MAELALVEGWVELELLGHRRHQGFLSVRRFVPEPGSPIVLQLESPAVDGRPFERHFYTPQAVYGIHPTTESAVVAHIEATTPKPGCLKPVNGEATDPCILDRGHDGDCEGLPF